MIELTFLGLILGFVYTYLAHQEKIESQKLFCYLFRLLGLFFAIGAIVLLGVNLHDYFFTPEV